MSKSVLTLNSIVIYAGGNIGIEVSMENQTPENIKRLIRSALFNMLDEKTQKALKAQEEGRI